MSTHRYVFKKQSMDSAESLSKWILENYQVKHLTMEEPRRFFYILQGIIPFKGIIPF